MKTIKIHGHGHILPEPNEVPQFIVPHGVWQGSSLKAGGNWALLGTTVAPGFDFSDFELGTREELVACNPA